MRICAVLLAAISCLGASQSTAQPAVAPAAATTSEKRTSPVAARTEAPGEQAAEPLALVKQPFLPGGETLSRAAGRPTQIDWAANPMVVWQDNAGAPISGQSRWQWHARGEDGSVVEKPAGRWWTGLSCRPADDLKKGRYEFRVQAADGARTVTSDTFHIVVTMPDTVRTKYHAPQEEFLGRLARLERTAFDHGRIRDGILDVPEVAGCDNPAMFHADGILYFLFGDPNIYTGDAKRSKRGLSGALAFTDRIVPEKGIDLAHRRQWVTDPATGKAKALIKTRSGISRVNNTGGAVIRRGDATRIWFALYDYGGTGYEKDIPGFRRYQRVAIAYSDNMFRTPAVRVPELVIWDRGDPQNGPVAPDPYLGYAMRRFKGHLYMFIPLEKRSPALIRCPVETLDECTLEHWRYLVAVDDSGHAHWSDAPLARGDISRADFPTVDFGEPAGIVCTVIWNPYMNRWCAVNDCSLTMWEAQNFWGPYSNLATGRRFRFRQFYGGYCFFGHELMLGNNGEWIYYGRARTWKGIGKYGVYNQRLRMRDKLKIRLSRKCVVKGDALDITCTDATGEPLEFERQVQVTVAGKAAEFVRRQGLDYHFSYSVSGRENDGRAGAVDVAAVMDVTRPGLPDARVERDVALIVNHLNAVDCRVTSHRPGARVSGCVMLEVQAGYHTGPEQLAAGKPEVRILKTELRHLHEDSEVVEDVCVIPPYRLAVDTTRYANGAQTFRVVAYDTLDRRGESSIVLNVDNPPQREPQGNLIADGNMEADDAEGWTPYGDCRISKTSGADHRSGVRSLSLLSNTPTKRAGFRRLVAGLRGGEKLRFTAWSRLLTYYDTVMEWRLQTRDGKELARRLVNSYGYFRCVTSEFENPMGNDALLILCTIWDTKEGRESRIAGNKAETLEAIVDDLALRPVSYPVVESPVNVRVADPTGTPVTVRWDPAPDVNVEYYAVYRRQADEPAGACRGIGEVRAHIHRFEDRQLPGPGVYRYAVRALDFMARESALVETDAVSVR